MKERIYFGHPINVYDTELEVQLLQKISLIFPQYDIENPNQPHHHEMYRHFKEIAGSGMQYFFEEVLPECALGVFLPFRDGTFGAGVFDEAKFFAERNMPVFQITAEGIISPIASLAAMHALTIRETRRRVYGPDGNRAPY